MSEEIPQELKDEAAAVLNKAAQSIYAVFAKAEDIVGKVSEQLEEWADALAADPEPKAGTVDKNYMYNYLLLHGNAYEKELYSKDYIKEYLFDTDEVLEAVYLTKVNEVEQAGYTGSTSWGEAFRLKPEWYN